MAQVVALSGRHVTLAINGDDVTLHESSAAAPATAGDQGSPTQQKEPQQRLQQLPAGPVWSPDASGSNSGSWVLTAEQFRPGVVGAKALSSAHLALAAAGSSNSSSQQEQQQQHETLLLPAWLRVPNAVALPHGCYEAVLAAAENEGLGQQLQQLAARVAADNAAGGRSVADQDLQQLRCGASRF